MHSDTQSCRWLGRMGSGKSAALRKAVSDAIAAGVRPIAYLPTVCDVGLRTERVSIADRQVAEALGAHDLMGRLVRNLSSGERQRVRLAAALSQSTSLAAFDEPCRHLDPEHVEALNQVLAQKKASGMRLAVCDCRKALSPVLFDQEIGEEIDGPAPQAPSRSAGAALRLSIPTPFLLSETKRTPSSQPIEIPAGCLVVVRGRNGSGKTSLIEALGRSARIAKLAVGISHQEPEHQVFASTPEAELREASAVHGHGRREGNDVIGNLGLQGWMTKPTPRIPIGALCLLGAVIALRMGRDLVLLDEPTQGLDGAGARALAAELVRNVENGARIVVASHDPELVRVSNRTWLIESGTLTTEGVS